MLHLCDVSLKVHVWSSAQGYSPEAALAGGGASGVPNFKAFRKERVPGAGVRRPPGRQEVYCEALVDGEAFLKCAALLEVPNVFRGRVREGLQSRASLKSAQRLLGRAVCPDSWVAHGGLRRGAGR